MQNTGMTLVQSSHTDMHLGCLRLGDSWYGRNDETNSIAREWIGGPLPIFFQFLSCEDALAEYAELYEQ